MPRPRTSDLKRASNDRLPGVDLSAPVELPATRATWQPATRAAYRAFKASEAAKSIRPAEAHLVTRYFDCVDREALLWAEFERSELPKTLDLIHRLHRMILSLGREVGISPLARRNLGVPAAAKPLSRLERFSRNLPVEPGPTNGYV